MYNSFIAFVSMINNILIDETVVKNKIVLYISKNCSLLHLHFTLKFTNKVLLILAIKPYSMRTKSKVNSEKKP